MKVKILEQNKNDLLNRTVVKGKLTFSDATPSKEELKKYLANELNSKEDLIIIKRIATFFGKTEAMFSAHIYTDINSKSVEKVGKVVRERIKKAEEEKKKKMAEEKKAKETSAEDKGE